MKLITKFEDEDFRLNETANVDIATMPDGRIKAQAVAQSGGLHTFFYNDLKTFANDWEDIPEEPPKDFRPEHLKRMGVTMVKGEER